MKIGLLICDHVKEELVSIQGTYEDMYTAMLRPYTCITYWVCDGHFPDSVFDCDAWLVGGSVHSVYDDFLWIDRLKDFVKEIYQTGIPYVGVCYGHQMLAEALGGKVGEAPAGWCLGVHQFEIIHHQEEWMKPRRKQLNTLMLCQDQVEILPPGSLVLANSINCPVAMFQVGERMIGIQGHPEFTKEYNNAIIEMRRTRYTAKLYEKAIASMGYPVDQEIFRQWILQFLKD